jgi:hypothetical protein
LYAHGKLIGGLDIVKELHEEGQLLDAGTYMSHLNAHLIFSQIELDLLNFEQWVFH